MKTYIITILLTVCLGCSNYATGRPWAAIEVINKQVNREIVYWDNPVDWQMPEDDYGDCTSYAMLKQLRLKNLGIDSQLASCRTANNKGHAVLLIDDYVLDNNHESIWHKDQLGYNYYEIQAQK